MKGKPVLYGSFGIIGSVIMLNLQVQAQQVAPPAYTSGIPLNYVRTWDATSPQTNPDTLVAKSVRDVKQVTQYFDGLGRPVQTVIKKGSLITGDTPKDLVSPVVYDGFGRETYKYLPFAANNTGGNSSISDGLFKMNPFQQDSTFNKGIFSDETYYYSKTEFEPSPLNRPVKTYAPGNNWVGASRAVEAKYWINTGTDSVRIWNVADVTNSFGTYSSSAMYAAGTLYKNVTVDESNN